MDTLAKDKLRDFIKESLQEQGDNTPLQDDDSLFISTRLDSLTLTNLVIFIEDAFSFDFTQVGFDFESLDTINAIEQLLDSH